MRIDELRIRGFKNLSDLCIDFDETSLETVLIGQNGAGKSNVIEALATIFRDLDDQRKRTPFPYYIKYECKGRHVEIDHWYSDARVEVIIDGSPSSLGRVRSEAKTFLPNH